MQNVNAKDDVVFNKFLLNSCIYQKKVVILQRKVKICCARVRGNRENE